LRPFRIHRLGIARTFQLVRPFLELRAYDNVKLGLMFGTGRHELFGQDPMRLLEVVGLEKSADSPAMNLNTNDRKKLELARALASEPELLLLDEIITGLNPVETDEFVALIREIKQQYVKTIVMVEHIMKVVMKISDRVIVLHHGQLIAQGKPTEVSQNEEVIGAYLGEKRRSV
jgi:branched-chain amino acid transport system ATP-binding protein